MIRRLEPEFVERVWGSTDLSPYYGQQERRIGEVWFRGSDDDPLLVKFIFTEEKLSVQVHPGDAQAQARGHARGKSEMWHILDAKPGAWIALGFREPVDEKLLRESIAAGTLETLLNRIEVHAGDTFYTPAGTVHAIGAGIRLCEIQQNSDVTYRLYDYGRPRELHVEEALAVLDPAAQGKAAMPVRCEHFTTEALEWHANAELQTDCESLLVVLEGSGYLAGQPFHAGEVWSVGPGAVRVETTKPLRVLRTFCGR